MLSDTPMNARSVPALCLHYRQMPERKEVWGVPVSRCLDPLVRSSGRPVPMGMIADPGGFDPLQECIRATGALKPHGDRNDHHRNER